MDTPMITLEHIVKSFSGRNAAVHAVRDVSLSIERGSIYGIVGFSGAGKSTLVRCVNLLERPTSGRVIVDGTELTALHGRALNEQRRKIGMIFQQFNLFATRTVFENVAFPLRYTGLSGRQIREKVTALLRYVDLSEKENAYPSQLSGGQKQRVAIARALASDPKVLLCDEETSALDPQTTASILKLLRRLNEDTGITIVIITHQMQVVKDICQRVAVMEQGRVAEEGDVYTIFFHPQQAITRSFVRSADGNASLEEWLLGQACSVPPVQAQKPVYGHLNQPQTARILLHEGECVPGLRRIRGGKDAMMLAEACRAGERFCLTAAITDPGVVPGG